MYQILIYIHVYTIITDVTKRCLEVEWPDIPFSLQPMYVTLNGGLYDMYAQHLE